jgi:hypothetical protein
MHRLDTVAVGVQQHAGARERVDVLWCRRGEAHMQVARNRVVAVGGRKGELTSPDGVFVVAS